MHLSLSHQGKTNPAALRSAVQAALVVAAALAGYLTFLPRSPVSDPAGTPPAEVERPDWAGDITRPDRETQVPVPITSASYLAHEVVIPIEVVKKSEPGMVAVLPKPVSKPALPPRRSPDRDDVASQSKASEKPDGADLSKNLPDAKNNDRNASQVTATSPAAVAQNETKPQRNLLSPVTDHLPTTGSLLRPFHVVGEVFHDLIKSF